jgi:hypothetical protein
MLLLGGHAFAATFTVDSSGASDLVIGATGLDVGGTLYDVTFADGSCTGVYDDCDSNADFPFGGLSDPAAAAQQASSALLALIDSSSFTNGPAESFAGCAPNTAELCSILIPFNLPGSGDVQVKGTTVRQTAGNSIIDPFIAFNPATDLSLSTETGDQNTYSFWTPTAVPLPAAFWLFGSALLALFSLQRRRGVSAVLRPR